MEAIPSKKYVEDDKSVTISTELPCLDKPGFLVNLHDGNLEIKSEQKAEQEGIRKASWYAAGLTVFGLLGAPRVYASRT